jgi:hypothetical protein
MIKAAPKSHAMRSPPMNMARFLRRAEGAESTPALSESLALSPCLFNTVPSPVPRLPFRNGIPWIGTIECCHSLRGAPFETPRRDATSGGLSLRMKRGTTELFGLG